MTSLYKHRFCRRCLFRGLSSPLSSEAAIEGVSVERSRLQAEEVRGPAVDLMCCGFSHNLSFRLRLTGLKWSGMPVGVGAQLFSLIPKPN